MEPKIKVEGEEQPQLSGKIIVEEGSIVGGRNNARIEDSIGFPKGITVTINRETKFTTESINAYFAEIERRNREHKTQEIAQQQVLELDYTIEQLEKMFVGETLKNERGWVIGTIVSVEDVIDWYGQKRIVRLDNGKEFLAHRIVGGLKKMSMVPGPGSGTLLGTNICKHCDSKIALVKRQAFIFMNGRAVLQSYEEEIWLHTEKELTRSGSWTVRCFGYPSEIEAEPKFENEVEHEQVAVDWLLRLRQLQKQGSSFEEALAIANAEFAGD